MNVLVYSSSLLAFVFAESRWRMLLSPVKHSVESRKF